MDPAVLGNPYLFIHIDGVNYKVYFFDVMQISSVLYGD